MSFTQSLSAGSNTIVAKIFASDNADPSKLKDTATLTVSVCTPPVDICPNVTGMQTAGPCADTQCVAPAAWNIQAQQCIAPNTAPTVTVSGYSTVTLIVGGTYNELGASWTDAQDGNGIISTPTSGSVNTNVVAQYLLTYSYTDNGGLTGSATRVVNVRDLTDEETCANNNGTWNGESCDYPPTPEESCIEAGNHWVDGSCKTPAEMCVMTEGMVWVNNTCAPHASCVGGQTYSAENNSCVEPVCTESQDLNTETHQCVDKPVVVTCNENQTLDQETNSCVDNPVVPTCTEAQHLEGNVCVNNEVTPPPSPETPTQNNGGNGGGNGPIVGTFGGGNGPIMGSVLGASTSNIGSSCTPVITTFMRMGKNNDPEQVKVLQNFLNKDLGISLEVNGIFDTATDAAVKQFQLKYSKDILSPWGISQATGYVYKTTSRWINMLS